MSKESKPVLPAPWRSASSRASRYLAKQVSTIADMISPGAPRSARGSTGPIEFMAAVKRFVRTEAPAILGLEPRTQLQLEMPLNGTRSFILVLKHGDSRWLLRAYPPDLRDRASTHVAALQLLHGHGVHVPQIIFSNLSDTRRPNVFLLEEFVAGDMRNFVELSPDDVRKIASELARLHSMKAQHWGRLGNERTDVFYPPWIDRIERDLESLQKRGHITADEARRQLAWFGSGQPILAGQQEFSLTHNDLHPSNGVFTADGNYYLLDVGRLLWGPAAREVVRAYHHLLGSDPQLIDQFNNTYFSAVSAEDARQIRRALPLYEAFYRLTMAVKIADRRDKREGGTLDPDTDRELLEELAVITSNPLVV